MAVQLPTKIVAIDSNQIKLEGSFNFVLQWGGVKAEQLPISKVAIIMDTLNSPLGNQQITLPAASEQRSKDCEIIIQTNKGEVVLLYAGTGDTVSLQDSASLGTGCVCKTIGYNNWIIYGR